MGGKRKKSDSKGGEEESVTVHDYDDKKEKQKKEILPSMIKNKEKRSAVHAKVKHDKKLEKRKKAKARDAAEKRALELGEEVTMLFFLFFFLFKKKKKLPYFSQRWDFTAD